MTAVEADVLLMPDEGKLSCIRTPGVGMYGRRRYREAEVLALLAAGTTQAFDLTDTGEL